MKEKRQLSEEEKEWLEFDMHEYLKDEPEWNIEEIKHSKMIYLCSPYTHSDVAVTTERVRQTTEFVNKHLLNGVTLISPVVYGHGIVEQCGSPSDWGFWNVFCHAVIDKCDEVWVLKLDRWEDSVGIKGEVEYAEKLGLEIRYVNIDE